MRRFGPDRGEKLSHYTQYPSIRAVLLVSHRRPQVTLVQRMEAGWEQLEHRAGELVELDEPKVRVSVDDLYAGVQLDA